jgi:hypothetical protein
LAEEAKMTSLKINRKKTEVMRIDKKQQDPLQLYGENTKETHHFTYLGSVINKDGGAYDDIKRRINKAIHAFSALQPIQCTIP